MATQKNAPALSLPLKQRVRSGTPEGQVEATGAVVVVVDDAELGAVVEQAESAATHALARSRMMVLIPGL